MELFLTTYDPSDLPGRSIDPLGFERGYLFLADKTLPGMTHVASSPRYFEMLCAVASHAGNRGSTPRGDANNNINGLQIYCNPFFLCLKDISNPHLHILFRMSTICRKLRVFKMFSSLVGKQHKSRVHNEMLKFLCPAISVS